MTGWYAVTLAAFCAGCLLGGWIMYLIHAARERRRFDAGLDAIERATDERHAGRHRVSEPRAALPLPPPGPRLMGKQPQPSSPPRRMWTDASHIPPVMWTVPGRPQAAPSKNGAADTQRIRRIKLHTATTGEIREVGDRIVAAIERGETP